MAIRIPARLARSLIIFAVLAGLLGGGGPLLAPHAFAGGRVGQRAPDVAKRARAARQAVATRKTRERVQQVGLRNAAVRPEVVARAEHTYSIAVPEMGIRNQRQSGRCWAYAWTKTLQSMALAKGCETEALSPAFINYYALRTLAHAGIDRGRQIAEKPEQHIAYLDADMLGEGGYAHWANHIVNRYGIVPERAMSSNSFDSRESHILQNKLHRLVAAASRDLWKARDGNADVVERRKLVKSYKAKVDRLLKTAIGAPPRKVCAGGKQYNPKAYLRDYLKLGEDDLDFVTISHDPNRAWNRRYRESYHFNGHAVPEAQTYNMPMGVLQEAVVKSLRDGVAVNVAVNVDYDNPHRVAPRKNRASAKNGILTAKAFDYRKVGADVKLSKRERMEANISLANHMMAITAHEPKRRGKPARWQVDNSHGKDAFRQGRFDMYDDFFRQYVEEVTVPRKALPKKVLAAIERKPVLDTLGGPGQAPGAKGSWTLKQKRALVETLIRQDLSIAEAAERYKLPVARVQRWYDLGTKGLNDALRD